MTFWMYKDVQGYWRWRLRAANQQIVAVSGEGYRNEADCLHSIALVKQSYNADVRYAAS